jgi:hypothetical protein
VGHVYLRTVVIVSVGRHVYLRTVVVSVGRHVYLNHDNVPKWDDMSTCGLLLLFQWDDMST